MNNHEIDYRIHGEEMQCVEIELDPNESVIPEPGSFMMMTDGIQMQTMFGDGNEKGFMGKLLSAGKRVLTGENLFMTAFTNISTEKRQVSFAAPYSGKIIPLDLSELGGKVICQKDSFLCAAKGVAVGVEFQRKLGTGLFGGEGFIMQKLEGDGMTFVHSGGHVIEKQLQPGVMKEKPRAINENFFSHGAGIQAVVGGIFIGLITMLAYWYGYYELGYSPSDGNIPEEVVKNARTLAFMVLVCSQLFYSLGLRNMKKPLYKIGIFGNRYLVGAIVLGILLQILVMFVPVLREAFKLHMLDQKGWMMAIVLGLLPLTALEIYKILFANRKQPSTTKI